MFPVCSSGALQPGFPLHMRKLPLPSSPRQRLPVPATTTRLSPRPVREGLLLSRRACIEVIRSNSLWGGLDTFLLDPPDSWEQETGWNQEGLSVGQQIDAQDDCTSFKKTNASPPDSAAHVLAESANDDIVRRFKRFLKAELLERRVLVPGNKRKAAAWPDAWMRDTEPATKTAFLNDWLLQQRAGKLVVLPRSGAVAEDPTIDPQQRVPLEVAYEQFLEGPGNTLVGKKFGARRPSHSSDLRFTSPTRATAASCVDSGAGGVPSPAEESGSPSKEVTGVSCPTGSLISKLFFEFRSHVFKRRQWCGLRDRLGRLCYGSHSSGCTVLRRGAGGRY